MQRAVKILAAFFATAAGLALVATVTLLVMLVREAQRGALPLDNPHLMVNSLIVTFGLASAGIYASVARALWLRRSWGTTVFFSSVLILFFPVGPVLGICSLILLTRPAVKSTFTS